MTRPDREKDANRALEELWGLLALSGEWKVDLRVEPITEGSVTAKAENASGCIEVDLPYLHVRITLNPKHLQTGEQLWETLAHECLHLYQAELIQAVKRLEDTRPALRPVAVELVQVSEMANVRVERLFLRLCPCPRWLKSRIYDPAS